MIENATLLRIDRATGATAKGQPRFTTGAALSVRCNVQDVTSSQRYNLGDTIKDASGVARIPLDALVALGLADPVAGDRLAIAADGEDPAGQVSTVVIAKKQIHGSQSHFEIFTKPV